MIKKVKISFLIFLFLISLFFSTRYIYAIRVTKGIWTIPENPVEKKKTKIFIPLYNPYQVYAKGFLSFSLGDKEVSKQEFFLEKEGFTTLSLELLPQKGEHKAKLLLSQLIFCEDKSCTRKTTNPGIKEGIIDIFTFFVDSDFDKDGLGDLEDKDDDNDNLPDEKELVINTDPKNPDTDADGIIDSKEDFEETLSSQDIEKPEFQKKLEKNKLYITYKESVKNLANKLVDKAIEQDDRKISEFTEKRKTEIIDLMKKVPFVRIENLPLQDISWKKTKIGLLQNLLRLVVNPYFLLSIPLLIFLVVFFWLLKKD